LGQESFTCHYTMKIVLSLGQMRLVYGVKTSLQNLYINYRILEQLKIHRTLYFKNRCILFGRIRKKTKLFYYGRTDKIEKYPINFSILLADGTYKNGVQVTFWNKLAYNYYNLINIGDLLVIKDYKIQKHKKSNFGEESLVYEISLNDGSASIEKLNEELSASMIKFSPMTFENLVTIDDLFGEKDGLKFDIVGKLINYT
jgi:hypothetical protein